MLDNSRSLAYLDPFRPSALLQSPMVNLCPPPLLFQIGSFLFRHLKVIGRPVLKVPVFADLPKHLHPSKATKMHNPTFRGNIHRTDGHIPVIGVHLLPQRLCV